MPLDASEKPADSPASLSRDPKKLLQQAQDISEICMVSQGIRAAYYRQLNSMVETGRQDGTRSLLNMLYGNVDRLASHLFSPTMLRFVIDFENPYPKATLERATQAGKVLTRDWERSNTDMEFGLGVFESLKYGASFLKQWVQEEGIDRHAAHLSSLVMPWQFGVYNEGLNSLSRQPAMCESITLTLPEVWRRIYHLPDADKLYKRIATHAIKGQSGEENNSFFHQVLSTSTLNTGNTSLSRPVPGGIVQLNNNPNYAILGPEVAANVIKMKETWVWDEGDYTTLQVIEPDILLEPKIKKRNLLIDADEPSGLQPYTLIQSNVSKGYIWGRSEILDIMEVQGLVSSTAEDMRRLLGLQIDKILAFSGFDGVTDETYDQLRAAGYFNGPPGSSVTDLTPKFPPEILPILKMLMDTIDRLSGFDNLAKGQGEQGVRSGQQTDTLMKMATPRLRDRALLLERQCAAAADLRFSIMEYKDGKHYWTNADDMEGTRFLLSEIPEDRRVSVDSHSSAPIFMDNHQQLVAFGIKSGFIDGHSAIDILDLPQKDMLQQRLRDKEAKEAQMMQQLIQKDPQALEKILSHKGGKR